MRFVVDVNLPLSWTRFLIQHGHSAVHWTDVGSHDDEDAAIFAWAFANDYAVVTCDLDFGRMPATSGTRGPSVVQLRTAITLPAYVGEIVVRSIKSTEGDLAAGALLTIGAKRTRLRRLPFERVV